jgi:hypothetical protein
LKIPSNYTKVYTHIKLQGTTPRSKDSSKLNEGSDDPKPTRATREASTFQELGYKLMTF